jgi:hypothetical protein
VTVAPPHLRYKVDINSSDAKTSIVDISVLIFSFIYFISYSKINVSITSIYRYAKPYCRVVVPKVCKEIALKNYRFHHWKPHKLQ